MKRNKPREKWDYGYAIRGINIWEDHKEEKTHPIWDHKGETMWVGHVSVVGTRGKIRLQTQIMLLSTHTFSNLVQTYMSSWYINIMQLTNLIIEMNYISRLYIRNSRKLKIKICVLPNCIAQSISILCILHQSILNIWSLIINIDFLKLIIKGQWYQSSKEYSCFQVDVCFTFHLPSS